MSYAKKIQPRIGSADPLYLLKLLRVLAYEATKRHIQKEMSLKIKAYLGTSDWM